MPKTTNWEFAMFAFKPLTFVVVLCLIVPVLHAATIHVPSEQPTIQAGIDAAPLYAGMNGGSYDETP